jgi:hypothetical protein
MSTSDEELGIVLTLKQQQQVLSGLKQAQAAVKGVGQDTETSGKKAEIAAGKTGLLSKKIDSIAPAAKRSGKVAGAMFGVLVSNSQGALGPIGDVQQKLMGVGTVLEDTKNKAAKWTIGVGAALTGAGAIIGTIVSKEETASKQLDAAISGAGGNVEKFQGQINSAVKTGEHYGDTAARTMSALNRLVLSTHNPQQAFKLYNSVLQISAARHLDVEQVALQVGRALHGQARSLQGFGIQLTSTTKLQTAATSAQKKHASAVEAVKKAQQALKDTQARTNASLASGTSSTTALASARLSLSSAQDSLNKATFNYGPASSEAALAQERVSVANQRYTDTLNKSKTAGGMSVSQQITMRNAHDRLHEAQKKLRQSTRELAGANKDLAKNGDVSKQIIKQTSQYMGGQASAAADTFTGKMHMVAAVIDDKIAGAGAHFYKQLVVLGPALMGVGAIMETGIVGKSFRGAKALIGFADAEKGVRVWSIRNMATQVANGAKIAGIWVFQTAKLLIYKGVQMLVTGATKAYTAAQWLLNAAMDANPIGIIIGLLVIMAAAFVVLWHRSATFRKIVTGAFHAVQVAAKFVWNWLKHNWPYLLAILTGPFGLAVIWIIKHWGTVKTFFKGIPGFLKTVGGDIAAAVAYPFIWGFDKVAEYWNKTAGKLSFHAPKWIPGFGGKGFSMPKLPVLPMPTFSMPKLHEGGVVTSGGMVNVMPNEEIISLPTGAAVAPTDSPAAREILGVGSEAPHIIQVMLDGKVLAETVHKHDGDKAARL